MDEINWEARLIGIRGARGVGKTTLLLQYIKLHLSAAYEGTLYVSLDHIGFSRRTLVDLADGFVKRGGQYLFLDEVHKYPGWADELKNIYDDYPTLKVVFTGSSLLEILNARADLSRRAVVYTMQGFSFREYLALETGLALDVLTLPQILQCHLQEAQAINRKIRPLAYFHKYLARGYYPFFKEQPDLFATRLGEVINMILEIELPLLRGLDPLYVFRIKQLLVIIAESAPFVPNISKLSAKTGLNRTTLLTYIQYLEEAGMTRNLYKGATGISRLQKPAKVFLDNTNLMTVLAAECVNKGNARETFFANQVGYRHRITCPDQGDFLVDEQYTFEIGGKGKSTRQIPELDQAYIAADDIEYGSHNRIPLWLFGFMY